MLSMGPTGAGFRDFGLGTGSVLCAVFLLVISGNAAAQDAVASAQPDFSSGTDEPVQRRPLTFHRDQPVVVTESERETRARNLPQDVPLVAYTSNAFGGDAATLGVSGFTETRASSSRTQGLANGGLRVFGTPIDRLTIMLDAQRREENNEFAPSLTAQVRLLGSTKEGWALSALGRYKTEGFAEFGGELEGGVLFSASNLGFHVDTNLIAGGDFDGGESDGEFLARGGYDLTRFLRVGAEGRGRYRLSGTAKLPGNRAWDAFGGAQLMAFADHYFGAVTAGPSTVGISDSIGWSIILNVGGVAF
jgi:hypothetical protein